jgi:hypothetical protein
MTTSINEIDYMDMLNKLCPPRSPTPHCRWRAILAFNPVSRDGILDALFSGEGDILEAVCKRCCYINLRNPGQALVFLCHFVPTERYCLCVDKALVSLLQAIPVCGLFKTAHRQDFRNFRAETTKTLECKISNLSLLDRYIDSPVKFQEVIRPRFSLIRITLEVYHWRHLTARNIIERDCGSKSFLSARERFSTFVSIESDEMDMLKEEFLGQMRNVRHEMKMYKGIGHRGDRRRVPSLRFVPRFSLLKWSTYSMFRTHSTHSTPLSPNDKDSNDLRLAASLSQMFFGNILEGQACSACFATYRRPLSIECSGWENGSRFVCCRLRERFIKSLKPSKLYRALHLVVARFLSSYDTFAIDSGLWDMSFSWYDPRLGGKNSFSRLLGILSAFATGMAECQKSRLLQTKLRHCFRSNHEVFWDSPYPNYHRYAEWFLENSDKYDLVFYFGLAAKVNVDCFDFATILNEMVTQRQDLLRELAEEPEAFADILRALRKLEGRELCQALSRALDMITSWKGSICRGTYQAIKSELGGFGV